MAEHATDQTLTEESPSPSTPALDRRPWLIYVGSPENGFAEAGRIVPLCDLRSVRFGRQSGENAGIQLERVGSVLHVGVPLGWVSSAHAELRVVPGKDHHDFDLRDLGSRNGTHIEGQVVPGVSRLIPGQIFEIGRSFWLLREVGDEALDPEADAPHELMATSNPQLASTLRRLVALAPTEVPLLLRGETGTGKEVTARAIHELSGRRGAFVAANLSAMTEQGVEALLFGQAGATQEPRPGLFEQAHEGTLFLDELAELPGPIQHKLAAAIAEGRVAPSGAETRGPYDVRVIASAIEDLHPLVQAGRFRPDLYASLAGFEATLPPLRSRREDLGALVAGVLRRRKGAEVTLMTRAFRRVLEYRWPYNVRELHQALSTAAILTGTGGEITRQILEEILERRADMPQATESVHELRNQLVTELQRAAGDTRKVAAALNRQPREIARWLERFDLDPERYRSPGEPVLAAAIDLDQTLVDPPRSRPPDTGSN